MREIKFRVWWTDATMMREVVKWEDGAVSFLVPLMPNSLGQEYELQQLDEDQYELMQYTGLKDKNGKEIYEGDIIEADLWAFGTKSRLTEDVIWNEGAAGFNISDREDIEIIGNIYENPDLLKS